MSESPEAHTTDVVEPSSKKPRISAPNCTLSLKSGQRGTAVSKVSLQEFLVAFVVVLLLVSLLVENILWDGTSIPFKRSNKH